MNNTGGRMIPHAVSITELRQNLPSYLDRVAAGEAFLVTVRGKVVARLAPEIDAAEAAYQRILSYRQQSWVGDVITPFEEAWSGDSDNV
jgi:prevent-host-death family protein